MLTLKQILSFIDCRKKKCLSFLINVLFLYSNVKQNTSHYIMTVTKPSVWEKALKISSTVAAKFCDRAHQSSPLGVHIRTPAAVLGWKIYRKAWGLFYFVARKVTKTSMPNNTEQQNEKILFMLEEPRSVWPAKLAMDFTWQCSQL